MSEFERCNIVLRMLIMMVTASAGSSFQLVSGATAATIVMLGALHIRRMYDDKKVIMKLVLYFCDSVVIEMKLMCVFYHQMSYLSDFKSMNLDFDM